MFDEKYQRLQDAVKAKQHMNVFNLVYSINDVKNIKIPIIHYALSNDNDSKIIFQTLLNKVDLNIKDADDNTVLVLAIKVRNQEYVRAIINMYSCYYDAFAALEYAADRFFSLRCIISIAAEYGLLELIKWCHENNKGEFTNYAMSYAAENGHLDVVKWFYDTFKMIISIDDVAKNGHLDVLQYLDENCDVQCTKNAMDLAAEHGYLPVVKYLYEHRQEGCTTYAIDSAAAHGHLDVVKYLLEHGKEYTKNAINNAAANGHLDVVRWLNEHSKEGCTQTALNLAARDGHLNVVTYLVENVVMDWNFKCAIDIAINCKYVNVADYLSINMPEHIIENIEKEYFDEYAQKMYQHFINGDYDGGEVNHHIYIFKKCIDTHASDNVLLKLLTLPKYKVLDKNRVIYHLFNSKKTIFLEKYVKYDPEIITILIQYAQHDFNLLKW